MGLFKDVRKIRKASKQVERPKMRDALKMGAAAVEQVQADQALAQHLAEHGIDGRATIQSLEATGKQVNYQPEIRFDLSLDVKGFTSEVTHTQVISPALLPQLQLGATVACKVDPDDHSRLML